MQPTLESALAPGTMIAGKYRVLRVVAEGGMGVIMEAENVALGQRVAVKFLLPEMVARPDVVQRFLREARAAARLRSDHVVRVFDIGTDERGLPFMVMELLSGVDLSSEIETRGALPIAEAVGYIVDALDAIIEAHALGIVHRDLKPANIFLSGKAGGQRRVRVLDFGISKVSDGDAPELSITSSQSMLGSPAYMSPEQVRNTKGVDARTDVWALGVILYEMLTGREAFKGDSLGDVFAKIREEDVAPLRNDRPDVPADLASVVHACLLRDREKRMPDAVSLRDRLLPFAGRDANVIDVPRVSAPGIALAAPSERELVEQARTIAIPVDLLPQRMKPGRRMLTPLSAALVLIVVAGGGALIFAVRRAPSAGGPATSAGAPAETVIAPVSATATLGSAAAPVSTALATASSVDAPSPSAKPSMPYNAGSIVATHAGVAAAPASGSKSLAPVGSAHPPSTIIPAPSTTALPPKKEDLGL